LQADADSILEAQSLTRHSVQDPNQFVTIDIIHQILEDAASAADDPYLGVHVGEALNVASWGPLMDAAQRATSLSDFLTRFILAVSEDATSARHTLEIAGSFTVFRERRIAEPNVTPSQNDAFTAAYVLSILDRAVGVDWDPQEVRLQVCTPAALPAGYRGIQIVEGDNRGMSVHFPTHWMTRAFDPSGFEQPTQSSVSIEKNRPSESFPHALRQMLGPHLGSANLTVDRVARLCGLSRQALQRRLNANGTNLSQEIAHLKKQHAIDSLLQSDQSISAIGESLGFDNPASFTRAFKTWTGLSPREYRAKKSSCSP
jgi:AraC-like DNA-binding protein